MASTKIKMEDSKETPFRGLFLLEKTYRDIMTLLAK